jgi:hypothetical protein
MYEIFSIIKMHGGKNGRTVADTNRTIAKISRERTKICRIAAKTSRKRKSGNQPGERGIAIK